MSGSSRDPAPPLVDSVHRDFVSHSSQRAAAKSMGRFVSSNPAPPLVDQYVATFRVTAFNAQPQSRWASCLLETYASSLISTSRPCVSLLSTRCRKADGRVVCSNPAPPLVDQYVATLRVTAFDALPQSRWASCLLEPLPPRSLISASRPCVSLLSTRCREAAGQVRLLESLARSTMPLNRARSPFAGDLIEAPERFVCAPRFARLSLLKGRGGISRRATASTRHPPPRRAGWRSCRRHAG